MSRCTFSKVGVIDKDINFHIYVELCLNYCEIAIDYYADLNSYLNNVNNKGTKCLLVGLYHMDDFRLYSSILKNKNGPPIIFVLTNINIPLAVRAMIDGAHDVLVKPLAEESLKKLILQTIDDHQIECENKN